MPLTGEEIRADLTKFVARWSVREGNERSEAQTFLTELFACFGQRLTDVARFEQFQAGGFVDLIWERVCIVEMKSATEAKRLARHRPQALGYWREAADPERNLPAPPYVVLCAFGRFEIWEPGQYPNAPRVEFGSRGAAGPLHVSALPRRRRAGLRGPPGGRDDRGRREAG